MALPNPDDYPDWRAYAKVLAATLAEQGLGDDLPNPDQAVGGGGGGTPTTPFPMPTGFVPVWLDNNTAQLYLGNSAYDPPTAPDLFQIDTLQLANAAVATANLANGAVSTTKIANLAVGTLQLADGAILTAKIGDAQIVTAKIADLAVNNGKIANLAVTSGKIANLAVGSAHIQLAAVGTAQIDNAAITSAKIQDLAVTSAKIASLLVDKLSSGQLNAVIDVAGGRFVFTVGGSQLILGNGFGSTNQFFLWYGPAQATLASCTEANGTVWMKTTGSAYFGGSLNAGIIRNAVQTSLTGPAEIVVMGPFGSNGNQRSVILSYNLNRLVQWTRSPIVGAPSVGGTTSATLVLERWNGSSWVNLATLNVTGDKLLENLSSGSDGLYQMTENMAGSTTFLDNSGGTSVQYRGRITARSLATLMDNGWTRGGEIVTQQVGIQSTEE